MSGIGGIQRSTVQCVFTPGITSTVETYMQNEHTLVWLYETIFTVLLVFFTALTAVNIINLIIWIARLIPRPNCRNVVRDYSIDVDTYLLLYMANLNVGPLAYYDLRKCLELEV
jgi:hypothetical protein